MRALYLSIRLILPTLYPHLFTIVNSGGISEERIKRPVTGNWDNRLRKVLTISITVINSLSLRLLNPLLSRAELSICRTLILSIERLEHGNQALTGVRPLPSNSRPGCHVRSEGLGSHFGKNIRDGDDECEAIFQRLSSVIGAGFASSPESRNILGKTGSIDLGTLVRPVLVEVGECNECIVDGFVTTRQLP